MTKREAAIITAFTDTIIGDFHEFHKYAEELLGRPVLTHEFRDKDFMDKLKELARPDLEKIIYE